MVQPAGQRDEFGVRRVDRFGEHGGRPGSGRIGQPQPGAPVGAVVTQHHLDVADHGVGMIDRRIASVIQAGVIWSQPPGIDNSESVTAEGYFRQLPPSTGSVTPVT